MRVKLRDDYQTPALDECRRHIREGAKAILINAPTGSGKTVLASALMELVANKGNRANFVVDRLSLIDQTSATLFRYGIGHGVIQADHPLWRPQELVQVCSVQTLSRRQWPDATVDIIDEAHVLHERVKQRIAEKSSIVIGLTATPFTRGLAKYFDRVVNVSTTNWLIDHDWLVPYRIFSCAEPDMEGVAVTKLGEWEEKETSKRALQVVGDVVAEYIKHGQDRKFICSAVDTAHCEELQRQFLAAGINVATFTYRDKVEDRAETTDEFRKPTSTIRGLVTVTAASRGFDIPDLGCVIMARPLRKSLAEHIQLFGRGLRISPETGKRDCLVLDHSGNCARFFVEVEDFFANGVEQLDDGKRKPKKAQPKKELEPIKCPHCMALHKPAPFCPACGHEYPRKRSVEHVPGTLKELLAGGVQFRRELTETLWPEIVYYVQQSASDNETARRRSLAIYKQMTGHWPRAQWGEVDPRPTSKEVRNQIMRHQIAYRMARSKQEATA